jgi:hypothetical protein
MIIVEIVKTTLIKDIDIQSIRKETLICNDQKVNKFIEK